MTVALVCLGGGLVACARFGFFSSSLVLLRRTPRKGGSKAEARRKQGGSKAEARRKQGRRRSTRRQLFFLLFSFRFDLSHPGSTAKENTFLICLFRPPVPFSNRGISCFVLFSLFYHSTLLAQSTNFHYFLFLAFPSRYEEVLGGEQDFCAQINLLRNIYRQCFFWDEKNKI